MIEELLYQKLKTISELNEEIYPSIAPMSVTLPFVVYSVVYDSDIQTLGSSVGSKVRFQLDLYTSSYSEAKSLKQKIKDALYDFSYTPRDLSVIDGFDDGSEYHRQIFDFKFNL